MILHGYEKETLGVALNIPYTAILKELKSQRKNTDSADYSINILLKYSTLFGKGEMSVNKFSKLKLPQPPEIEVAEIKYTKVPLKSIHANAKIKIINHSAVTLSIKEMKFSISILKQGNLQ